jgi:hypothetical protein
MVYFKFLEKQEQTTSQSKRHKEIIKVRANWMLMLTPKILATWRLRSGGSQFKTSPGKYFLRLDLKK